MDQFPHQTDNLPPHVAVLYPNERLGRGTAASCDDRLVLLGWFRAIREDGSSPQARLSRDNLDENGGGNQGLKRRPVAKS